MRILQIVIDIARSAYSIDPSPRLFGSKKRRKDKENIRDAYLTESQDTQSEIDVLKAQNPYETAAAKAAMAKASQTAKLMQKRQLGAMGAGATAEAMLAAQDNASQAVGDAAGQIAVGAEANQQNQLAQLRGLKSGQMGAYGEMGASAASERGSGWNTLFQGISSLGSVMQGTGQAAGAIKMAAGGA